MTCERAVETYGCEWQMADDCGTATVAVVDTLRKLLTPLRSLDGVGCVMLYFPQHQDTIWRDGRVAEGNGLLNRRTG